MCFNKYNMKNLFVYSLLIFSILSFACKMEPIASDYKCGLIDSSTVILSIAFPDTKKHIENDLVIFTLIKNGEYIPIDDFDNKSNKYLNERDSILREVNSFYACINGSEILIKTDSIVSSSYDCDDLRVGRFSSKLNLLNNVIASNSKIPCNSKFERINKDTGDSLFFKITNDSLFKTLRTSYKDVDFELIKLQDSNDILCVANAGDSVNVISNLYFINSSSNSLTLLNSFSEELELDSWGRGFEFFDYRDVDNDKIPELFIIFNGYEWTTMIVCKKVGNKYVKKLETTIFGC